MEEVPKILSPDVSGVFHIFANMLDVKSFMNLAMTSKNMYKRCMEDKEIEIDVDVSSLTVSNRNGSVEFDFSFANVANRRNESYVAALQKLPCVVKLRRLKIRDTVEPRASMESKVHKHMKDIGVNKIHELTLTHGFKEWEMMFAIIKTFKVSVVNIIHCEIKEDILRSLLQLNLEKLSYNNEELTVDFILTIDSPIQDVCFPEVNRVSKDELLKIVSKIQSGSLHRLTLNADAVDWDEFHSLPFDHKGQLPDGRPLLFERLDDDDDDHNYYDPDDFDYDSGPIGLSEYWFLHEDGGVTKCVEEFDLQIFKCDPRDYPWILRKEEDIFKDLTEKRQRTFCSANQYNTFHASFDMIDSTHQGELPKRRPLYIKAANNRFWLLDEDDNLMQCSWENGCATWTPYYARSFEHPALAKYMFWNVLKQVGGSDAVTFSCEGVDEFNSWLANFSLLPFDYSGPLPNNRPLIFEKALPKLRDARGIILRIVLLDDRLLQCELIHHLVFIKNCHYLSRPPILFSAKTVLEMLKDPRHGTIDVNIPIEEFLDGLNQFKQSILVLEKRLLISEWMANKFWYWDEAKFVWKVEWSERHLSFTESDICGSPPYFMKQVFRNFAVAADNRRILKVELEEFNSCLEQFTVVAFDYSGPLTGDSPIAFVKNDIRHTCDEEAQCQCSEVSSMLVLLLWDRTRLTKCSWGENGQHEVHFGASFIDMPPALKTKEYLKFLLQIKYDKTSRFEWFGSVEDFRANLEDYLTLPFDFRGPLPGERPLLFEKNKHAYKQFLLRADGTIVKITLCSSPLELSLYNDSYDGLDVPPALKSML